jgi:DNA mismatch endonuclease, patch repair protein
VIFVHGCFWHQHGGCKKGTLPQQNGDFWKAKLRGNRTRDKLVQRQLVDLGWTVIVVWECEERTGFSRLLKELEDGQR